MENHNKNNNNNLRLFSLSGVILVILVLISDNVVQTDVNFKSNPTTVKTYVNDTVLLPCYAKEPYYSVRWINQDNKLIADSQDSSYGLPNRILYPNGSLSVIDLKINDTGDYICEVNLGNRVIKQINSIEVQVAPEVLTYPSGVMNVTIGAVFQITCETKGVPPPEIHWLHNGHRVNLPYNEIRRYTVEVRNYDMAGPIECVAMNGVGTKSTGITLVVNFAPEIMVDNPIVHSAPGMEVKLDCFVDSYPDAKIHWFFNGMPVRKNNLVTMMESDLSTQDPNIHYSKKRHTLKIRNVREADFGRYECKAGNSRGASSGSIELMGRPLQPTFEVGQMTPTTMLISWQTKSQSPIIDYTFRFRHVSTGNEDFRNKEDQFLWRPLTIPADKFTGVFHTKNYLLTGLLPATVYEMTVKARNQFGSSEDSKIQQFSTPSKIDIIKNASTIAIENDMNYDEIFYRNNGIHNSAYNVATQLNFNNKIHYISCLLVVFVTFFQQLM